MKLVFRGIEELPDPHGTRVVHLSDLHLGKGREPDEFLSFEGVLEILPRLSADVVVVSGDLIHVPDDAVALSWVKERLDSIDADVVVVPGNHDIANPDRPEAFVECFGVFPRYEVHHGVGFALFDSFCGLGFDEREAWEHELFEEAGHLSTGAIPSEQFEIMASLVDQPWIAVLHHHVHEDPADAEHERSMKRLLDSESFLSWCESFGCRAILHGHKHAYAPVNVDGSTPVFRGGATTKLPAVFRVLDLADSVEWHEIEIALD